MSEITLGLLFYVIEEKLYFFILLFGLTLAYTIGVFLVLGREGNEGEGRGVNENLIESV